MLITNICEKQDMWSITALKLHLSFQQLDHGWSQTQWEDIPNSIDNDGDSFLPG